MLTPGFCRRLSILIAMAVEDSVLGLEAIALLLIISRIGVSLIEVLGRLVSWPNNNLLLIVIPLRRLSACMTVHMVRLPMPTAVYRSAVRGNRV